MEREHSSPTRFSAEPYPLPSMSETLISLKRLGSHVHPTGLAPERGQR